MRSLRASLIKNGPEVRALLTGCMPSFVTGSAVSDRVPVFFFHGVGPERFEAQLRYLRANGYRALDADELEARLRGEPGRGTGREVALTFDDATWTFWTYAFPLLRRYEAKAILFAIPGLVPEDPAAYPSLADVWDSGLPLAELAGRGRVQPLCTWRELEAMHASGLVDIQSHSLTHSLVPVSPRVQDFVHPGFDAGPYANADLPLSSLDDPERPERRLRLGAPVFEAASSLAGRARFVEEPELISAMTSHVEEHGGTAFFERPAWRRELASVLAAWPAQRRGRFEGPAEGREAMRRELVRSKALLEERLPGKAVRHFCYPWFESCALADRLAAEAGYRTVHAGVDASPGDPSALPLRIQRISEEYLFRLPGEGRGGITRVWIDRVRGLAGRTTVAAP
jgi:peptidoglycan/xylan/chitin deacetylase (PgdA/CDA1 family)